MCHVKWIAAWDVPRTEKSLVYQRILDWFYKDFIPGSSKKNPTTEFSGQGTFNFRHPAILCLADKKILVMFLPLNISLLMQPIQAVKLHYKKGLLKRIVISEGAVRLKDAMIGLVKP